MDDLDLQNTDAVTYLKDLPPQSIQCIICDPPFGIGEDMFDKHYARNSKHVIEGYQTAPTQAVMYQKWAESWIHEIPRVMKSDGTLYIVCAWNHVCDIELAIRSAPSPGLTVVNHIIWKYNFGVYTQKKFVSSHYHILRCSIGNNVPKFYNRSFFNETDKTEGGGSSQYLDMEDVWIIPKEYSQGSKKNVNKLPDALVRKMIKYSSAPGDVVADFFLGNFTTAYVARREGRRFRGCEINENTFNQRYEDVRKIEFTTEVDHEKPSTKPENSGKSISEEEKQQIISLFDDTIKVKKTKKETVHFLMEHFGRGYFSIINVLKSCNR